MAFPKQFLRANWLFRVQGTEEIADTSLAFAPPTSDWTGAAAALQEIKDNDGWVGISGAMTTMLTSVGWATYSELYAVKVAAVGTDGKYLADPYILELDEPVDGTQEQIIPQATVVLSLRSGSTLGKGNYGRMYLPHTQSGLGSDSPYIPESAATAVAGYMRTFVNDTTDGINDVITAIVTPVIMSQAGAGAAKPVLQVGTGRVVDTQRRRRNRLDDTATLVSLL